MKVSVLSKKEVEKGSKDQKVLGKFNRADIVIADGVVIKNRFGSIWDVRGTIIVWDEVEIPK
jgi:hypothetical protein